MKSTVLIAAFCASVALVASAQAGTQVTQTETKYVTVDGDVVRYEPGRTIVLRGADNKEIIYTLSPHIVVPAEVKVGRRVTLYTEPGTDGGTQIVSRVTTTSVTPEGNVKRTTEDTRKLPSGATTRTTTTNITGQGRGLRSGQDSHHHAVRWHQGHLPDQREVAGARRPGDRQDHHHPAPGHHRLRASPSRRRSRTSPRPRP